MEEVEQNLKCPYCGEKISMLIDLSTDGTQTYTEDCEVCCRPIQITFTVEQNNLTGFSRSQN
jgi:hypothetical protein